LRLDPGSYSAGTDGTGFFSLVVPVNTYRATVDYNGESFQVQDEINVKKDSVTSVNFNFSPVEGFIISHPVLGLAFLKDISSVNLEELGYSVLSGAQITLTGAPKNLVTDGNGYFKYDRVISGLQTLEASFENKKIQEILVVTSNNDTTDLAQSEPVVANITMLAGSIRQFLVYGINDAGELILPLSVDWTVVDSAVGTVNSEGIFIALGAGTTEVFADFAGTRVIIVVTVTTGVGNITGHVTDGLTGQPAEGVTVSVSGVSTFDITDTAGEYFLEGIPANLDVLLTASRDGVLLSSRQVTVLPDTTVREDIILNSSLLNPPSVTSLDDGKGEPDKDSNPYPSTVKFEIKGSNFGYDREAAGGEVNFIDLHDSGTVAASVTEWNNNMIKGEVTLGGDDIKKYLLRVTVMGEDSSEEVYYYKGCRWEYVGDPAYNCENTVILCTDIKLYNGKPFVAFEVNDGFGNATVSLISYDGTSWQTVGESNISGLCGDNISLSIYNGIPYIAYRLYQDGGYARVKYYNSSLNTWQELGSQSLFTHSADYLSLYASSSGLYLSYIADGGKPLVMKYDYPSDNWSHLGSPLNSAAVCAGTSLYIAEDGSPYIAYKNNGDGIAGPIFVEKYDGIQWSPVGGSVTDGLHVYLCLDNNNNSLPFLAHRDGSKPSVTRGYSYVGQRNFTDRGSQELCMCVGDDGSPYVAYTEIPDGKKVTVMKYTGEGSSGWEFAGVRSFTSYDTFAVSLDTSDNIPYLVCYEGENLWSHLLYHLKVMKAVYKE